MMMRLWSRGTAVAGVGLVDVCCGGRKPLLLMIAAAGRVYKNMKKCGECLLL